MSAGAGVRSRIVAWRALRRVTRDGAWASQAVDRELRAAALDGRDRAFAANLAFQTLRWRGTLDWALSHVVRRRLDQVEPGLLDVLRLGAWQVLYGQMPDRAAVSTAVDAARAVLPARTVGFANGVLRALARRRNDLPWPPADTVAGQALALGYPEWVVVEARRRFGGRDAATELDAGNAPAPLTVRGTSPSGAATDDGVRLHTVDGDVAALAAAGVDVSPGRLAPEALHLSDVTAGEVVERFPGLVVQDEASMVVGRVVHAAAGDGPVLDVCAAPGGKATHVAQLGARVVAADRHEGRLHLAADLADRVAVPLAATVADGTRPPWRSASFGAVLVDAPCTGLGTVRRRPALRWTRDAADVGGLAPLQARLLDASADLVAAGGALVYSVCTWTCAETIEVVDAFASRHPAFAIEAPAASVVPTSAASGTGVQLGSARHGTDGMYVAVLRRTR